MMGGGLQLSICLRTLPAVVCCSLSNIHTVKLYSFIPLPLFCLVAVVKFGAVAGRCVPMRADAADAVISHTDYRTMYLILMY